jgi:hypothetical protein
MVGRERIEEIIDPELTIERALDTYAQKGYSPEWINQRLQTIRARKELTDAWKVHGVKEGQEYAILTDEVTKAWSGMSTRQYKNFKGLKKENLRDNMSTLELALNMLAEATTTELANAQNPQGLEENRVVAKQGGAVAAMFGKYYITSKTQIQYQCATANCAYFRLTDGSRYVAYSNGDYWTAAPVSSDIAARNYFMERTGGDYSFIILDD